MIFFNRVFFLENIENVNKKKSEIMINKTSIFNRKITYFFFYYNSKINLDLLQPEASYLVNFIKSFKILCFEIGLILLECPG